MNLYSNGLDIPKVILISDNSYVFMGCSYTFGHGVYDNETLPHYIQNIIILIIILSIADKAEEVLIQLLIYCKAMCWNLF
jgi:hypothetical protein